MEGGGLEDRMSHPPPKILHVEQVYIKNFQLSDFLVQLELIIVPMQTVTNKKQN